MTTDAYPRGGLRPAFTREDLREWRTVHSLSQQRLADLLGVHWVAVSRWEAGHRKVPSFLHLALRGLELDLASVN